MGRGGEPVSTGRAERPLRKCRPKPPGWQSGRPSNTFTKRVTIVVDRAGVVRNGIQAQLNIGKHIDQTVLAPPLPVG